MVLITPVGPNQSSQGQSLQETSDIGTAEYCLAKYLDTVIKPCIKTNHTVCSTSEFIEKLQSFNLKNGDYSGSFDLCSLYTNNSLEETIKLVAEKAFSSSSANVPPFSKKTFIKFLTFVTSGMFPYNKRLYKQINGVAMGSSLGPFLANFSLYIVSSIKLSKRVVLIPNCMSDMLMIFSLYLIKRLSFSHFWIKSITNIATSSLL